MNWKRLFLNIGKRVAREMVPGVAGMEEAVTEMKGPDKQAAVMKLVENSLVAANAITDKALLVDAEFLEGLRMINDGNVKVMRAIKRLH